MIYWSDYKAFSFFGKIVGEICSVSNKDTFSCNWNLKVITMLFWTPPSRLRTMDQKAKVPLFWQTSCEPPQTQITVRPRAAVSLVRPINNEWEKRVFFFANVSFIDHDWQCLVKPLFFICYDDMLWSTHKNDAKGKTSKTLSYLQFFGGPVWK